MLIPTLPHNEEERLRQLQEYQILDTMPEKDFDDITSIASEICQTPISLITLIDGDRQFFKSRHGLNMVETPRDISLCAHTILKPDEVMIIPNTKVDERFTDNPLVNGNPEVLFYAGVPLINPDGHALGTLCVLDSKPRELNAMQIQALKALANQVVAQLELRRKIAQLEERELALRATNAQLDKFASVISHDLKSPLNNMLAFTQILQEKHDQDLKQEGKQIVDYLHTSAEKLRNMINGVLELYRSTELAPKAHDTFLLSDMMQEIIQLLSPPENIHLHYNQADEQITTSRIALQIILQNLISNAIRYNDKPAGNIEVKFTEQEDHYKFEVKDDGPGIPAQHHQRIFRLFQTFKRKTTEEVGTGIGLSTVQTLVEKLGGEVSICSELGKGTSFSFTIKKH